MASTFAQPRPGPKLMVNVFDGTRQPISLGARAQLLIRLIDGNQHQLNPEYSSMPSTLFEDLPFFDNFGDNYTVIVSADGYRQAGFTSVKVSPGIVQHVDLMLLPEDAHYNFKDAKWKTLQSGHPELFALLKAGAASDAAARDRYSTLLEDEPDSLAALLNITTAMADIHLPAGTALDYFKELKWDELRPDRIFGFADRKLVEQVSRAAEQGTFAPEFGSHLLHPGATSSYKQVQFGEANVQITFHDNPGDQRTIDGLDCLLVEPDIDYYRDPAAHLLLEVLPNQISGTLTDPRQVYVLRWIAGRHAGVPEFDPPYVLEA